MNISVMITSSFTSFLIAIVNLITFKNQVVSKSTNFQKQHQRMLVTIFHSICILNLFLLIINVLEIGLDVNQK